LSLYLDLSIKSTGICSPLQIYKINLSARAGAKLNTGVNSLKGINMKKKKVSKGKKEKKEKQTVTRANIRCKKCFLVDGYTDKEKKCYFCGESLFR
jgi:hypothetical protein